MRRDQRISGVMGEKRFWADVELDEQISTGDRKVFDCRYFHRRCLENHNPMERSVDLSP